MRIFYTENKQTGQLIFFVFGHFDQKTKNEKWNEPDIYVYELEITTRSGNQAVGSVFQLFFQNGHS